MPVVFNPAQPAPSGAKQLAQGLAGYNQGQQPAPMVQTQGASPEAIGKLAAALLKLKKPPPVQIAKPATLAQGTAMSDAASSTAPPPSSIPDSSGDSGGGSMDA